MALEEFTSGGARDFRQRYLKVFGFFPVEDREILVRVTEVSDARMSFTDERGIQYTAYADKGVFFRFIPVTKRLFYYDGRLCLAHRKPARQYQRGITYANTVFQTVYGTPLDVDFDSVKAYVNYKSAKLPDGCKILTDYLGIVDGSVFLYNQMIGAINEKNVALDVPVFRQEVIDALRINNMKQEVLV